MTGEEYRHYFEIGEDMAAGALLDAMVQDGFMLPADAEKLKGPGLAKRLATALKKANRK